MVYGYNDKVLMVDLTTGKISIENPGEKILRKYSGGNGLGMYYCMRDIPKGADPLGPDNVLALTTGPLVGAPIIGASRMSANSKSPVTNGVGDAQAGGFWAPALKFAGYDAVIIKGKAEKPVYIYIKDGKAEIRDAGHLWGMTTKDYEQKLREEISKDVVVAGIGPAGENVALFACIINERKHSAGRTGMGAVMGSKNLKCVAVEGKKPQYEFFDKETLQKYTRLAGERMKVHPGMIRFNTLGTNGGIINLNDAGMLPTKNFSEGHFEPTTPNLTSQHMNETISIGVERCHVCNIACKRHVACNAAEHGVDVDPDYGGPEYETVASFGSYLMIDDMPTIAKANEMCNAYGIDTISAGATIAFAMECYEKGALTKDDLDGIDLTFGNREGTLQLLKKICYREGCGNLLADGPAKAAKVIGKGSEKYDISVKGNPHPAHMPQIKDNLGLHYAINSYGSDHMSVGHDVGMLAGAFENLDTARLWYNIGMYDPIPYSQLVAEKCTFNYYTNMRQTLCDCLGGCLFVFGGSNCYSDNEMIEILNAITGWNTSLFEMMKTGERTVNLMRLFAQREGHTKADDILPDKNFDDPFTHGPTKGATVDKEKFLELRDLYYQMAGWDVETGHPTMGKIVELGLQWAKEMVDNS